MVMPKVEALSTMDITHSEGPSPETWEVHRPMIKRLYLDEDKTLPQVMEIMKRDYDFKASVRMYKRRLGLWKIDGKNLKKPDVKQIARQKVERDAVGKPSRFFIKGREVDNDNVQRYLKKRGFSSLEEFDRAASPVTQSNDVRCSTPAHSPMSPVLDSTTIEDQVLSPGREISSPQCSQSLMELSIIQQDPLPSGQRPSLLRLLSLSPETRSRRLLSLSPICRAPSLPKSVSIPERMLSTLSIYLKGNFEAGAWETKADGHLSYKNLPTCPSSKWVNYSLAVTMLISQRKYVQFRQVLSQACREAELSIKFESTNFVTELVYVIESLHEEGLPEIASIIVNYCYNIAKQCLGAFHPVAQICGMLQKTRAMEPELGSRLVQCQLDHLEKELGPWHANTVILRNVLFLLIDASEALPQVRAILAAYEMICSKPDRLWFRMMIALADVFRRDRQYANAERVYRDVLDASDAARKLDHTVQYKIAALWYLSFVLARVNNNIVEAEEYARQAVAEGASARGWRNPETIRMMMHHARLLRQLGKLEEAGEVEIHVEDILGPPEIDELLD